MLGIDIGHGAIKLVVIDRRRRGWCLRAFAVQRLPLRSRPVPVAEHGSEMYATVRDALATALKQLPTKVRGAAVALSCSEAITRTIHLEAGLSDQEIENQLAIAAEQHLPFPLGEAGMDFCRLPRRTGHDSTGEDVLMVAVRQSRVAQQVSLLSELGVRADVVDLDALALNRAVSGLAPDTTRLVLDLGATGFRLHAFTQERLIYSRAHQWVAAVAGLSQELAHGMERPTHGLDRATAELDGLTQEVKRAVHLFLISTTCQEPVGIFMVGGLAMLPGLPAGIAAACGRPASVWLPSPGIQIDSRISQSQWQQQAPLLAQACALAMRAGP